MLIVKCVTYVSLEHKTSHKGQFCAIEMYASSESWINIFSIDVRFGQYLESEGAKKSKYWENDL